MHSFLSHLLLLSSVLLLFFVFIVFVGQYERTTISPTEATTILSLLPSSQESQSTTINPTSGVSNHNNDIKPSSKVDNNGWGVSVDPVSGRMFYHHPVHGSQWEKPKGWVDQDQTMTTANTSTSDSTAGSGAGSGSGVGSSSGGSGSGSGGNNAVLPYGWSAAVDPASGRTFYYRTDQPSGTSQWDRPLEPTTVNNNNNNNNRNNMTRSDKSVGSLYTANSSESSSCLALYYPHITPKTYY